MIEKTMDTDIADVLHEEVFYQSAEFWVSIAFIFVVLFLFSPMVRFCGDMIKKRISRISNQLQEAEILKVDAQKLYAEYERKFQNIDHEISEIISNQENMIEQTKKQKMQELEHILKQKENDTAAKIDFSYVQAKAEINKQVIEKYSGIVVDLDDIQRERDNFLHSNQDSDIYLAYCTYLIKKYKLSMKNPEKLLKIRWDMSNKVLQEIDFKPGVVELILKLKDLGFPLILATMTTQVQLDIYSKKNQKMLNQLNISEVFDLIIRKEDEKKKKPDPEIYNMIMQYYNATPNECLIIEDSYTGVLASKNAGVEVINIYDKYADLDRDKINRITDYSILNYREFIDYLDSIKDFTKQKIMNIKKVT